MNERILDFASALRYLDAAGCPYESARESDGSILVERVCSRCGGSGEYSRCEMHGTRCFGCVVPGNPSRWKERANAMDHARNMKKRAAVAARAARERAVEEERQNAAAAYEVANWDRVVAEVARAMVGAADERGWIGDYRSFARAVVEARKAANLPEHSGNLLDAEGRHRSFLPEVQAMVREMAVAGAVAEGKLGGHVGVLGEAVELPVKLVRIADYEAKGFRYKGQRVTKYLHVFENEHGARLVWFAERPLMKEDCERMPNGSELKIRAFVKEHGVDRDRAPQTVVVRVRVLEVLNA